jgi:RNA recognition motif-containing protein
VFVGGLNYTTTDDGLRAYFEQFGEVVDCVVMKNKDSDRSRGFGK